MVWRDFMRLRPLLGTIKWCCHLGLWAQRYPDEMFPLKCFTTTFSKNCPLELKRRNITHPITNTSKTWSRHSSWSLQSHGESSKSSNSISSISYKYDHENSTAVVHVDYGRCQTSKKPRESHILKHRSAEIRHTFWSSDIRSVWVRIQTLYWCCN